VVTIFIWQEAEDEVVIDSLRSQLDTLKESEVRQWNPRGNFVVVVTDSDSESSRSVALEIYETMWTDYRIIDTVIIVSNSEVN
jgi:nitrate reductase NapAB chaperone NapD